MILAYSYVPVVEEILIERLTKYLHEDCNWKNLFPNYPRIKITNEYPWVPYMESKEFYEKGWIDLSDQPDLFPSITIITNQDQKSPQVFHNFKKTQLEKTEFAEFQALTSEEGNLIAPEALTEMETYFQTNDTLYGFNVVYQKRDTIAIDITTDDHTSIKNRIYDLVTLFLIGHGNTELKQDLDIQIIEPSVTGNRSGTYNIEFGRVLRGASIQCEVDYKISQVFYNTDITLIQSVEADHTVGG